MTMISPGEGTA